MENPQNTENTAIPRQRPIDTTSSVSLLRKRRKRLRAEGSMNTPTRNHMIRKKTSLLTLMSISPPSTLLLMAMDESTTIITTAKRSSTISTAKTREANFFCLRFRSVKAFMIIVVEDMESIPPRNRLLMVVKSRRCPMRNPVPIMPVTIMSAVTTAEPPVLSSFLKLNSRPRENSSTMIPICAQNSMFSSVVTEGSGLKLGLARNPATIYPSTTGCLIHLNSSVTTAPSSSMNAKSDIRLSIIFLEVRS